MYSLCVLLQPPFCVSMDFKISLRVANYAQQSLAFGPAWAYSY